MGIFSYWVGLVTWKSKKHNVVSKISSEVEYRAISTTASKVTWLVRLLAELGVTSRLSVTNLEAMTLDCDNHSVIHIANNLVHHEGN